MGRRCAKQLCALWAILRPCRASRYSTTCRGFKALNHRLKAAKIGELLRACGYNLLTRGGPLFQTLPNLPQNLPALIPSFALSLSLGLWLLGALCVAFSSFAGGAKVRAQKGGAPCVPFVLVAALRPSIAKNRNRLPLSVGGGNCPRSLVALQPSRR